MSIENKLKNMTIKQLHRVFHKVNVAYNSKMSRGELIQKLCGFFPKVEIYRSTDPKFQKFAPRIKKLMKKCWGKDEIVSYPGYTWYIVLHQQQVIAALAVDSDNIIWNLCTDPKFRSKGHASLLIREVISDICQKYNFIYLYVDNSGKNYEKLIKFYQSHGFEIPISTGISYHSFLANALGATLLQHVC